MEDVCSKIKQIINSLEKQMIIIAIDGRCAAGKTTFADLLKKETGCSVDTYGSLFSEQGAAYQTAYAASRRQRGL